MNVALTLAIAYVIIGACTASYLVWTKPFRYVPVSCFLGLLWPVFFLVLTVKNVDDLLNELESDR